MARCGRSRLAEHRSRHDLVHFILRSSGMWQSRRIQHALLDRGEPQSRRLCYASTPFASSFDTNTSLPPLLVKLSVAAPGSKSAVPANAPLIRMFPLRSRIVPPGTSSRVPPIDLAKTKFPLPSSFDTNTSSCPELTRFCVPALG